MCLYKFIILELEADIFSESDLSHQIWLWPIEAIILKME